MNIISVNQDINPMKINLSSFAKNFYKNATVNDVLKEAVMNSIQANATSIDINLVYEYGSSIDGNKSVLGSLNQIIITDNGDGLTSENIAAFFEVATDHKEHIGGKGIGRISFLNISRKIDVESLSKDGKKVQFNFDYDVSSKDVILSDVNPQKTYTKITLSDLKLKHPKTQVASCISFLREKFNLMLFLKQKENEEIISINVFVNGDLEEEINSEDVNYLESTEYKDGMCNFKIYAFKNDEKKGISISYYANNLQVNTKVIDRNFKKQYTFAVTSAFFDESVNPERTKFDFREYDESLQEYALLIAPNKGFEDRLRNICLGIIQKLEPDFKEENQAKINKLKARYGYINIDDIDPNDLFLDEKMIVENYRKKVNEQEDKLASMIDAPNISVDVLANRVSGQNKHELAKYIFHRDLVARKGLELTGSKKNEDVLHNLFFPQKITSNSELGELREKGSLYENNIWLLDDRFMSYVYAASEVTMKRIYEEIGDGNSHATSNTRPDLFILYNSPPEENDSFKDVVLVEFKKGDINYKEKLAAIYQVDEYKETLLKLFNNIRNFYCYIICDFKSDDKDIERAMLNAAFTKVFSNNGCMYYGYLPGSETHVTFVSSKSIFADAVARNETFLSILKSNQK